MQKRCKVTGLSVSYAYKKGCRCPDCVLNKQKDTKNDKNAAARSRKWYRDNPERGRVLQKRHRDKQWLTRYTQLLAEQGPVCAICGRESSIGTLSPSPKLHMDHNHVTGKYRGLLCGNCNVALGHFQDSVEVLSNAISYLLKYETRENGEVYPNGSKRKET